MLEDGKVRGKIRTYTVTRKAGSRFCERIEPEVDAMAEDPKLDEALEESFPASDPPANTVETGIAAGVIDSPPVEDNTRESRFELHADGQTGFLLYRRTADTLTLVHTELPEPLRGRHLGDALVRFALETAHADHLRVVAICPFARAYLQKHP